MKLMWGRVVVLSVPLIMTVAIAACTAERDISQSMAKTIVEEPRYCYQHSVGRDGIRCYTTPVHRDERQLVGYTGPPPNRFPRPPTPKPAQLYAPDAVTYWVKDAELIPEAAPVPPGRRIAPPPIRKTLREKISEELPIRNSAIKSSAVLLEPLADVSPGTLAPADLEKP